MAEKTMPYYNRELSWMDFNTRVLEEAFKKENPLMERLRFLAITGSPFVILIITVTILNDSNYFKITSFLTLMVQRYVKRQT